MLGLCVAGAALALALAHPLAPEAPTAAVGAGRIELGDVYRGETLYQERCASCHGGAGEGGVGPALAGSGLAPARVKAQIDAGGGAMPAGLVTGQDELDVLAFVDSIAGG